MTHVNTHVPTKEKPNLKLVEDLRQQLELANKKIRDFQTENKRLSDLCTPNEDSDDPKIRYLLDKLKAANENISFLANENDILLNKYRALSKEMSSPVQPNSGSRNESHTLEFSRTNFNSPFVDKEKDELIQEIQRLKQELKAQNSLKEAMLEDQSRRDTLERKSHKKSTSKSRNKSKSKKSKKKSKSKKANEHPVLEREEKTVKIVSRNSNSNQQMINEDAFSAKIIDSLQNELVTTKQELINLKSKYKKIKHRSKSRKKDAKKSSKSKKKDKKEKKEKQKNSKSIESPNKYSVENVGYDAKKSQELQ